MVVLDEWVVMFVARPLFERKRRLPTLYGHLPLQERGVPLCSVLLWLCVAFFASFDIFVVRKFKRKASFFNDAFLNCAI